MHKDFTALQMISPDVEPRVTTHMLEIIKMIEQLIAKKHAYVTTTGDVLFSVESFAQYGQCDNSHISSRRTHTCQLYLLQLA
jgi:cysteinyl-tRNA synthetase